MRLLRIIIAILTLAVVITFAGSPATTMAVAPSIVEVSPRGDSFHFIRVCGWKNYTTWGCVERGFPFGTSGGRYRTSQTWITERGVYTDIHFDHNGARRCDGKMTPGNGPIGIILTTYGPYQSHSCGFNSPGGSPTSWIW